MSEKVPTQPVVSDKELSERNFGAKAEQQEAVFTEEELVKLNTINLTLLRDYINSIFEKIPYLSGKNRENAENDLQKNKVIFEALSNALHARIENFPEAIALKRLYKKRNSKNYYTHDADEKTLDSSFAYSIRKAEWNLEKKLFSLGINWINWRFATNQLEMNINEETDNKGVFLNDIENDEKEDDFDPDDELLRLTYLKSNATKNVLLDEYKKELMEQKLAIAKLNEQIGKSIVNVDTSRDDWEKIVADESENYRLSPVQVRRYKLFFDIVEEQRKRINTFLQEHRDSLLEDIFEYLCDKKPVGNIEIAYNGVSIVIYTADFADYTALTQHNISENSQGCVFHTDTLRSKGLDGKVIAINGSREKFSQQELSIVIDHEIKHIIYEMVSKVLEKSSLESIETDSDRYLSIWEDSAKDEIIAYMREAISGKVLSKEFLFRKLLLKKFEGGHYDYLTNFLESDFAKKEPDYMSLVEEVNTLRKQYEKHVEDGIQACVELCTWLPRDTVIALLQTESLRQWPKICKRLAVTSEFQSIEQLKEENLAWCDQKQKETELAIKACEDREEKSILENRLRAIGCLRNKIFRDFKDWGIDAKGNVDGFNSSMLEVYENIFKNRKRK